ncbi:cytochrome c [uncultured Tateyamaria sp.]|uniref:c-type cytochrome n=1 Tax=uncultured Tateyamaria sp. TaxID=455651 RepID=UPI0026187CAA|nr:cytochrome c [uncultured Tateyamaria sp.]
MCMYDCRSNGFAILLMLLVTALPVDAQQHGTAITEAELQPWDISIAPDGHGLPEGSGTAQLGAEIYAGSCAFCHGDSARGGPAGSLAGGIGTLTLDAHEKTVGSYWPYSTTVFDYIRRAMPYFAPGSLTDEEVYAVTAYLLHVNGIISENFVLDADTLPAIQMPNRDGFISHWPDAPK